MSVETIHHGAGDTFPIFAEVDRSSDPGRPAIRLECGCNEFWLDADEAAAVLAYLQRVLPTMNGVS